VLPVPRVADAVAVEEVAAAVVGSLVSAYRATEQRLGILAGAKYSAKLDKTTLRGSGDWTDPKTKEAVKLTFFLELAK